MKAIRLLLTPFLVVFLLAFFSCKKQETYPVEPSIAYLGFTKIFADSSGFAVRGILSISFTDGDGDLGLADDDTFPPFQQGGDYYYNLVIRYFEKQNGTYQERQLSPPFSARIPVLTPNQENKNIKGVISDTLDLDPRPDFDTIRLEVYIFDRALHKSNSISTPDIVLDQRPK